MVTHAPGNYGAAKVYYANARLGGKTMLLAGPFLTAKEAEETLNLIGPRVVKENPECRKATFGVVEMRAPGDGPGHYNDMLPERLMGNLGLGVRLN
jgi:hypothetical protein